MNNISQVRLAKIGNKNFSFKFLKKFQSCRTAHSIGMAYNTKTCSVRGRRNDTFTDVTKSVQSFGLVDSYYGVIRFSLYHMTRHSQLELGIRVRNIVHCDIKEARGPQK